MDWVRRTDTPPFLRPEAAAVETNRRYVASLLPKVSASPLSTLLHQCIEDPAR